jgi:hypothetical protein
MTVGGYQILFWPRGRVCFAHRDLIAYRWIVYLWPVEVRRFRT